jgi:hypothetical protein
MDPRIIIVVLLIGIVLSLGSGMFFLMRDGDGSKRTVRALTVRITLSVLLIVFLVIGFLMGWIQPHGIGG